MLSVVIPIYNAADTLEEAFQSALKSGVPNQEIVLVDDGSTDGSWELIRRYQRDHENVVSLRHHHNRGGGAARNTGVRAAKYDQVFVLDSDDVLVEGSLAKAITILQDPTVDGVATAQSIFFQTDVRHPSSVVDYRSGSGRFEDVVSNTSTPFTINLLFRRSAFERVGGYPEHHGFDTQAFGFRLLANQLNLVVGDSTLYFHRLPAKPSYYIREARAGNINRNWFYILLDCLYKFSPDVRKLLLEFDYSDPVLPAQGRHVFKVLSDKRDAGNVFSQEGLLHDDASAYEAYTDSSDATLQAWCASIDLRRNDLERCLRRIQGGPESPILRRALYPVIALWSGRGLDRLAMKDFRYFFGEDKPFGWHMRRSFQRVLNRIG